MTPKIGVGPKQPAKVVKLASDGPPTITASTRAIFQNTEGRAGPTL
jgi:hypothetical protein